MRKGGDGRKRTGQGWVGLGKAKTREDKRKKAKEKARTRMDETAEALGEGQRKDGLASSKYFRPTLEANCRRVLAIDKARSALLTCVRSMHVADPPSTG